MKGQRVIHSCPEMGPELEQSMKGQKGFHMYPVMEQGPGLSKKAQRDYRRCLEMGQEQSRKAQEQLGPSMRVLMGFHRSLGKVQGLNRWELRQQVQQDCHKNLEMALEKNKKVLQGQSKKVQQVCHSCLEMAQEQVQSMRRRRQQEKRGYHSCPQTGQGQNKI